jgi:hypothetical protein
MKPGSQKRKRDTYINKCDEAVCGAAVAGSKNRYVVDG